MFEYREVGVDVALRLQSLDLRGWQRLAVEEATSPGWVSPDRPPGHVDRAVPANAEDPPGDEEDEALHAGSASTASGADLDDWAVPLQDGRTTARGPACAAVLAVQRAVDDLAAAPVSGRPVDVGAVLVLAERLRGLALRALSELDATGQFLDDGAASAAVWLRDRMVIGDDAARSAVRLASRLRTELPGVAQALVDGTTTAEHARAVAAGTAGLDPEVVAVAEESLLDLVAVADPAQLRRELRERAEAIDPRLGEDAERRRQARQGFYADTVGGGVLLGGTLADEDGAVLLHGLDLAVEADRQAGDTRGLPARRAAVLVQWARQAAAALGGAGDGLAQDARTVRSHLLVTCTLDQLRGLRAGTLQPGSGDQLALLTGQQPVRPAAWPTGAGVVPTALRRLACDSTVTFVAAEAGRLAGQGPVRVAPLYVGRSSRTVSGAQLKALVVRDRHCVVRGCSRRPAQCEAHHVRHWLDGGSTDLDNLVLLCHQHHHDHHDRRHDLPHRDGRWITAHGWGSGAPPP